MTLAVLLFLAFLAGVLIGAFALALASAAGRETRSDPAEVPPLYEWRDGND